MSFHNVCIKDKYHKNFIVVIAITALVIIALIALAITLYFHRDLTFARLLAGVSLGLLVFILVILLTTISSAILMWYNIPIPTYISPFAKLSLMLLFPITSYIGKALGIRTEDIGRTYTLINNQLVMANTYEISGQDILLLTPHCLQKSFCPHKITHNIDNCKRCGKCDVDKLLEMKEKYGVSINIVTGGSLARKIISKTKPQAIIAIACERDLISGLKDVKGIPVVAVVNKRPEGPCFNTEADIEEVEKAIIHFIKE
ncbi:DUF116 domain-containing protein [Alkaliphilus serpentinus]|uniref:DUF116 domain-containing protein n=1 Tax=Alkaliphilus serpentinus TaxID=1482731 RepID=A0A833HRC5_9FIRM|nr:DUF116 domain-containing protein [Alkaliphilus serpentinus]KAB3533139.1 DUF116 domain-containing protein [Alkaliphilus serpentinus]